MLQTLNSIRKGETINEQKLNDMKFEGKFATKLSGNTTSTSGSSAHISTPSVNSIVSRRSYWGTIDIKREKRLKADDKQAQLFIALGRYNNIDAINWINSHTSEVSNETQDGSNALHITASIGRISLTREILSLDILDVNAINSEGRTALDLSVLYGYWKTFDILSDHGAKLSLNGQLLLQTCVSKGYWELASRLLSSNYATVTDDMLENVPTSEGLNWLSARSTKYLPIEMAVVKGAVDIVRDKINTVGNISWKGLEEIFIKSTNDYISIVKLLLDSKKASAYEIIPLTDEITWLALAIVCCIGERIVSNG